MKRILLAILSAGALSACDNPTDADAGRYDLIEYFGSRLPVNMTYVPPGTTEPLCRDSLIAGYLELASGSSGARVEYQRAINCPGERAVISLGHTGTYVVTRGDTVRFTWRVENNDLISTIAEIGIRVENQLRIPHRRYSEADPNGTTTAYIVFQRQ